MRDNARRLVQELMQRYFLYATVVLLAVSACGKAGADRLRDGDLIFQTSRSGQSQAIQKATHSMYSHMGIVFFRQGKPHVYEAIQTVQFTPLKKWINRGAGGHFVIKRLRDADKVLTPEATTKLRQTARQFQGKPYDFTFEWSDDRIYCSELVWKIYHRGVGIGIGRLQKLGDFDLSHISVKAKLKERFGTQIPVEASVISPAEMFSSELLQTVEKH